MNKSILFRIQTESKNLKSLKRLLDGVLKGYTLINVWGFWKGKAEKSLIIEYYGGSDERNLLQTLARTIQIKNKQEAVLLTECSHESRLIV